jgi:6-phosphofructokinase 1
MSALATGAERFYLPEEGIKLSDLQKDVENLKRGFQAGKKLGLVIRSEYANPVYTTNFICSLLGEEGRDLFDVRPAILGHLQQGGDPSPFDRIQATRLASQCLDYLIKECKRGTCNSAFIGLQNGQLIFHDMRDFDRMVDVNFQRPMEQWWLQLKGITNLMAKLSPAS